MFISIRSAEASPQIGEILLFCDIFPALYTVFFFLTAHAEVESVDGFFTFYGSYDVFSSKDGPFRGCDNIGIYLR